MGAPPPLRVRPPPFVPASSASISARRFFSDTFPARPERRGPAATTGTTTFFRSAFFRAANALALKAFFADIFFLWDTFLCDAFLCDTLWVVFFCAPPLLPEPAPALLPSPPPLVGQSGVACALSCALSSKKAFSIAL